MYRIQPAEDLGPFAMDALGETLQALRNKERVMSTKGKETYRVDVEFLTAASAAWNVQDLAAVVKALRGELTKRKRTKKK